MSMLLRQTYVEEERVLALEAHGRVEEDADMVDRQAHRHPVLEFLEAVLPVSLPLELR